MINKNGIIKTFDLGSSEIIDKKINEALIATERIYADSQELWDEVAKEYKHRSKYNSALELALGV